MPRGRINKEYLNGLMIRAVGCAKKWFHHVKDILVKIGLQKYTDINVLKTQNVTENY